MEKLKRDPQHFLSSADSSTSSVSGHDTDAGIKRIKQEKAVTLDEFTLNLLQCGDIQSLGSVVKTGLSAAVPDCYGSALFYLDENTGEVFTADHSDVYICAPKPQCISNVFTSGVADSAEVSSLPQSVLQHLPHTSSNNSRTKVGCFPVCKNGCSKVLAVLVVVAGKIDSSTTGSLPLVIQQIAACYNHIQRTFQSTRNVEERASQQLIKLCGELYDQDAAQLQLKVLRYLEEQTQAECAFLYLVVPETQELFCQVIGKKILPEEERFSGQSSCFSVALETKQPMSLDDIPVESRKTIEEKIDCPLRSFLCVPVTSRSDNNLIALACVANKQNANRFTDRDISCIHQCFRFTSTVLTSTLAFQNERKLKVQTQALLQVARDLFTNLGKCSMAYSDGVDSFPIIKSRGCEVNVCGALFLNSPNGLLHSARKCRYLHKGELDPLYADISVFDKLEADIKKEKAKIAELMKEVKEKQVEDQKLNERQVPLIEVSEHKDVCEIEETGITADGGLHKELDIDYKANSPVKVVDWTDKPNETEIGIEQDIAMEDEHLVDDNNDEEKLIARVEKMKQAVENMKTFPGKIKFEISETDGLLSPNSAASDSDLSFATAYSDNDGDSFTTDKTLDDIYVDSVQSFFPDDSEMNDRNQDLVQYSPDILGFLEETVSTKGPNKSRSEPVCVLEQLPELVSFKVGWNEVYQKKGLDDAARNPTDYSDHDLSGLSDLTVTGLDSSYDTNSPDMIPKETNKVENSQYNCKDENAEPMVLISVSDANISHIQAPRAVVGSITDNDLTKLLREIMQQARNLTHAERCSVFLIDRDTDELVAKVFDGITTNKDNEVQEEIRMPITQGIAGNVATSGELLNIRDAYSHPLFYRGIDDSTGFRTRNILCFPIKDEKGRMLGVAQLCNKQNCPCFTQFDEEIATAFGVYCCISISHSLMYKKVIDSQVRSSLANELMMYHMKSLMYRKLLESQHRKSLANELMIYHMQVSPGDVHGLSQVDIPHPRMLNADFLEFSYAPRSLPEDKTLLGCLSMFEDLSIISRWRIRRETLARFVLMVKKGYRNPPYHNWMHAYTVAQFCYQLIKNLKLENSLDDIELFALFVSCLCHDIDHRGTNNSFQTASSSVLAALYSSEESVLERHHFAQTMCILNTEGCNVFENLNSKDYQHVLDLMRDIILATDLAHHFKILKSLKEIADRGFNKTLVRDRKLLLCLLMTSCDLSDQTRPWANTKIVAALIYKEFFSQGDMEKEKGLEPSDMMDRERAQIPALQIGFLEHVALPVYRLLSKLFPDSKQVGEQVEDNKQHWIKISNFIQLKRGGSQARMTFEEVLAIEDEADKETAQLVNGSDVTGSKC